MEELYALQQKNNVSLLYEASVCGSIPIIRSLEEYFDNEELEKVSGVFNGTTNYILTKTISEKLSYAVALKQAQEKGFAESDPTNDVEGFDAKYKAIIVALHAFGLIIPDDKMLNLGITTLHEHDIRFAAEKSFKIKLTPVIKRLENNNIAALLIPQFIPSNNQIFNVDNEFNGVIVEGKFSGEQFLKGKGAGSIPTGSAVLSDLSALSYGYKYEFKKHKQSPQPQFTNNAVAEVYLRYNSDADLEKIHFEEINETYAGRDYHYVVGKINIRTLIEQRDYILKNRLFVALMNDRIELAGS